MSVLDSAGKDGVIASLGMLDESDSFVLHDLSEHAGVNVIEIAGDVHMPWCPRMRSNQRGVLLQRSLIILNADAASLIEFRDIGLVLVFVCVDDAVGRKGCRTAMRVVNDHDVLYPEQVLGDGDGAQRIDCAPSGNDDGEHGRGRCHAIAEASSMICPG